MLGYFDDQLATEAAFNAAGLVHDRRSRPARRGRLSAHHRPQEGRDQSAAAARSIPARIEELALRYAGLEKAAAFPVADPRLGERVCLAVVMRDAAPLDPERAHRAISPRRACRAPTCRNSCCRSDRMPLTASGKIVKRELIAGRWRRAAWRHLPVRSHPGTPPRRGLADASRSSSNSSALPRTLRVRETPAPVPGPGEVLVEIHAAPVNYVDMLVVGGVYQFMPTLPFIPGKRPGRHRRGGRPRGDLAGGRRPGAGDRRVRRLWRGRRAGGRSVPPPAG